MARIVALENLVQFAAVNLTSDPGAIPGPVVVPQCAQINFVWALGDGKLANNVLFGRYSGGFAGTQAQCNAIMTALTTGGTWTALAAFLAPTASFAAVQIRDVNTPNQPIIQGTNTVVPGTSTGTELPNEVAAVITKRTAKVGRQFRGRIYVPGFATNATGSGNIIAATAVTALNNWAALIATAFSAQGYTHVLGLKARAAYTSPVTGRPFPARAATSEAVTAVTVKDNHWDTQRRRGLR